MDEEGVILKDGLKFDELMKSGTVFEIDTTLDPKGSCDDTYNWQQELDNINYDADEMADMLEKLNLDADKILLTTPGCKSFDELASQMLEVHKDDVKIHIIDEGDGPLVPLDSIVTLHYSCYYENSKVPFDCSMVHNDGNPVRLRLGQGKLLPGLELGLTRVRGPRAQFQLLLSSRATWGQLGCPPRTKAERSLFTVSLLDVQDLGAIERFNSLPVEEQTQFSTTMNAFKATSEQAKEQFNRKKYLKALYNYHRCIYMLQRCRTQSTHEEDTVNVEMRRCYTNLTLCYIKLDSPRKALKTLDQLACRVVQYRSDCKVMYLYGKSFFMLGDYEKSVGYYKTALNIEPKNTEVAAELVKVEAKLNQGDESSKRMWKFMFNKAECPNSDSVVYNVDDEFRVLIMDKCRVMSEADGFVEFKLPKGLLADEVGFVRQCCRAYQCLTFVDDTKFQNDKQYKIVKK